jgi:predicted transposase/invertase (TIGR01784 family)
MQTYDKLWKGIIEDLFEDFLCFFYPDADQTFDFSKGFEFLDKELEQLFPESKEEQTRYVDKLVKVWLKDGTSRWILIHCEVQGYFDKNFGFRMFVYYYRILDKYDVDIASIAILSDDNPNYNPNKYEKHILDTKITFEFKMYKILAQKEKALSASDNPFAIVILTVLKALKNKKSDDENRMNIKLDLIRELKKKNYTSDKIRKIFFFIKQYIRFENEENNTIFDEKLEDIYPTKNRAMGVIEILIEDAEVRGIEKGLEKGVEKGVGIGVEKKNTEIVGSLYTEGMPIEFIARVTKLSQDKVQEILKNLGLK